MLRFHGSYQLDQMDNREVFQLFLLVSLSLFLFLLLLAYHLSCKQNIIRSLRVLYILLFLVFVEFFAFTNYSASKLQDCVQMYNNRNV